MRRLANRSGGWMLAVIALAAVALAAVAAAVPIVGLRMQAPRRLLGSLEWEALPAPWSPEILPWGQRVVLRNVGHESFEGTVAWRSEDAVGAREAGEEKVSLIPGEATEVLALLPPPGEVLDACRVTLQAAAEGVPPETVTWSVPREAPGGTRRGMKLDGAWEYRRGEFRGPQYPPDGQWTPVQVPVNWCSPPLQTGWYRRQVTVPSLLRGEKTLLQFDGVGQRVGVYWNGKLTGEHFCGYVPWEVDVTGHVRWGEANEIVLSVERDRELEKQYGSSRGSNGAAFWNEARLLSRPAAYVENVFVIPSVEKQRLTVRTTLRNTGPAPARIQVRSAILDAGRDAATFPAATVDVPAGGEAVHEEQIGFRGRLWWPHDPHLYTLRTDLSTGDRLHTRFGFREFGIRGTDFTLNGVRCFFRRGSMCPRDWAGGVAQVRRHLERLRAQELNSFRTHYAPAPTYVLEMADEMGLLVVSEGAAMGSQDDAWWSNFAAQWEQTIRRGWNHPSLVLYSTVNEFKGDAAQQEKLHAVNERMQALDPTRVVSQDSSSRAAKNSAGSRNRALNWHYPWRTLQAYPNWLFETLKEPQVRSWEGVWDRDRPLMVGEFLCPPCHGLDPMASLVGEDLYLDEQAYYHARGLVARHHCDAYRLMGLAGANPWGRVDARTLPPVALLWRDWSGNVAGGETFARDLTVDNTTFRSLRLRVAWEVVPTAGDDPRPVVKGSRTLSVGPGEKAPFKLSFRTPRVPEAAVCSLNVVLTTGDEELDRKNGPLTLFPRQPLAPPKGARVVLHDPEGATAAHFRDAGLTLPQVDPSRAGSLDGVDLVLVAENIGTDTAQALAGPLRDFAERGGRVVILAQESAEVAAHLAPGQALLEAHADTRAFPRDPDHPLLEGIPAPALCHWKPDGNITRRQYRKPSAGSARVVTDSGGRGGTDWVAGWPSGLEWTPLTELRRGRGTILLCQFELAGRLKVEPAARRLLQNLLDYAAAPLPDLGKCGTLIAGDKTLQDAVTRLGLVAEPLEAGQGLKVDEWPVVLAAGDAGLAAHAPRLRRYVEEGGRLLIQGLTPEGLPGLTALLGEGAPTLEEGSWISARRVGTGGLTAGLSHRDFWWAVQPRGSLCNRGPQKNDRTGRYADPVAPLADFALRLAPPPAQPAAPSLRAHTEPVFLASADIGRGQVVVCQMRWDRALDRPPQDSEKTPGLILPIVEEPKDVPAMTAPFARRVATALLTNLGARIEAR